MKRFHLIILLLLLFCLPSEVFAESTASEITQIQSDNGGNGTGGNDTSSQDNALQNTAPVLTSSSNSSDSSDSTLQEQSNETNANQQNGNSMNLQGENTTNLQNGNSTNLQDENTANPQNDNTTNQQNENTATPQNENPTDLNDSQKDATNTDSTSTGGITPSSDNPSGDTTSTSGTTASTVPADPTRSEIPGADPKETTEPTGNTDSFQEASSGTESTGTGSLPGENDQTKAADDSSMSEATVVPKDVEVLPELTPLKARVLLMSPSIKSKGTGVISGTVEADGSKTVIVTLRKDGKDLQSIELTGKSDYTFSNLPAGDYQLVFTYKGESGSFVLSQTVAEQNSTASSITATATGGTNVVTATVTTASPIKIIASLRMLDDAVIAEKSIDSGVGSVTFTGVAAGNYKVFFNYDPAESGISGTTVGGIVVTDKSTPIEISSVSAGENSLTVKGKAQSNASVTINTEPVSTPAVVSADASGNFNAVIICTPGKYTEVNAQYGTDSSTRVKLTGNWEVKTAAGKPELTVDTITESSTTVSAVTSPGITIVMKTSDYTQTLTSDAKGFLRFSLPHTYVANTEITFIVSYGKSETFTQIAKVTKDSTYQLLKLGVVSDEVTKLTTRLAALKYPVVISNRYTENVMSAVRMFQERNGLTPDGVAGESTQLRLYSVTALAYDKETYYPTLVRGDRGISQIYSLQTRLKELGYYSIRVDGIYGSGTQRAVRWFQEVNGLPATGKADNTTQQLLFSSSAKPAGSGIIIPDYQVLDRSNRYQYAVVPLQRRLKELGYYGGSIDGYYGSRTALAVRNFQRRNGIAETGVAGIAMQQLLYSASAIPAGSVPVTPVPVDPGYRLLYWGCKGDAVRRLQQALLNAGYSQVRYADGIYGKWTYDAVCAFQKNNGLSVDGIAGKKTQNKLYGTHY